jgi:hypothetical protein
MFCLFVCFVNHTTLEFIPLLVLLCSSVTSRHSVAASKMVSKKQVREWIKEYMDETANQAKEESIRQSDAHRQADEQNQQERFETRSVV